MYALILLNHADLISEYDTREAADAAYERILEADGSVRDELAILEIDARGRTIGVVREADHAVPA
jgi:hypothetical protein